jgi:hypothetical protein
MLLLKLNGVTLQIRLDQDGNVMIRDKAQNIHSFPSLGPDVVDRVKTLFDECRHDIVRV